MVVVCGNQQVQRRVKGRERVSERLPKLCPTARPPPKPSCRGTEREGSKVETSGRIRLVQA